VSIRDDIEQIIRYNNVQNGIIKTHLDIIASKMKLQLFDAHEVQQNLALYLRARREATKLSRSALAKRSLVPASTIKKFELTGKISLRQFLLLWQSLDDLARLHQLTQPEPKMPTSIEDVLKDGL